MPWNASACTLVIAVSTPSSLAWRLVANTFVRGAAPAKIATPFSRRSGSRRTTACAGKSGTNRHAKANVRPLNLVKERDTDRTFLCLMACASASERNRRIATGLANASLLPELQNLRTSKHLFEYLLQLGSNGLFFSGSGEPAKHNFSRRTLLPAEAESSACSQSLSGNETMCSTRCDAHPPRRFRRDR